MIGRLGGAQGRRLTRVLYFGGVPAFPSLSAGALSFLDMSGVLEVHVEALVSSTVDRGRPVHVYGASVTLAGPYVFDDAPGRRRNASPAGSIDDADATLYVHPEGPRLLSTVALGVGDRVTVRGRRYLAAGVGDYSELAQAVRVTLQAEPAP